MKNSTSLARSSDRVIESFQQTMQAFLEVQKSTMLAYLAGRGAADTTDNHASHAAPSVAEALAFTPSNLASSSNIVNGNGSAAEPSERSHQHKKSDGIGHKSRVKRNRRDRDWQGCGSRYAMKSSADGPDRTEITARLLETVRDRTGYPIETLGLDLDMEADLGIDSIKRVEILGKLRDEFPGLKALSDTPEMMDAMARARTLGVIVERMTSLAQPPSSAVSATATLRSTASAQREPTGPEPKMASTRA